MTTPEFGALTPTRRTDIARRLANRTPGGRFGRLLRSALVRLGGGRQNRGYDLEIFDGQRARIWPVGNLCEKRVFTSDRHWEVTERAHLRNFAARLAAPDGFYFIDVGANVGLYTLAARAIAQDLGREFHAILIEPQPQALARLRVNLAASGAHEPEVQVFAWAATAEVTEVSFSINSDNQG
ncbi:MAG: FkbM family methyltransferase, partial [Paracoccaceae bacterium]